MDGAVGMTEQAIDRFTTRRRVRTPTVLQMEAVECGAAALSIILRYYKRKVPLEVLRNECGVNRDGSKASNVIKAARRYGMEAKGYRKEIAELQEMRLPLIIFWNFNHFLVLEGFKGDRVFLNDPASGPRVVSFSEFDEGFTGVVLDIHPGKDFVPGGSDASLLSAARSRLTGSTASLVFLLLLGLALVIPGLLAPIYTKVFIDEYLIGQMDSWVKPLLVGMVMTAIVRGWLSWLQSVALLRFSNVLSITASSKFLWHVLRLPLLFYTQRSAGEISNRVGINDKVAQVFASDVAGSVLSVMMIVFYAGLMFFFDVFLTVVAISIALMNIVVLQLVARKRSDSNQRLLMDDGKVMATAFNGLRSIETLKASGTENDFFGKWSGFYAKSLNSQQALGASTILMNAAPSLLTALNTALILSVGGMRVMDGALTIGALIAFQSLTQSFINPVNQLVEVAGNIQEMTGDMKRLDDVLDYETDAVVGNDDAVDPSRIEAIGPHLQGYLDIRNLAFGFSPLDPPLIDGFNLSLKPGMRVALVGPSGCGKSTISKLVMGLYKPTGGEILFDGMTREAVPRPVLTNSLAMVDQDISVFMGTIRDNLTLWDTTISDETMVRAAKDANIHDDIIARPGGYDSEIDESGGNFSGGQLQRLEIARALIVSPRLLVLDEATSALDTVSEQIVDSNLRRRGCTCLIVAHRLSTIRDCDEIIVLDRGKVVQRGTHDDMKDVPGPYADLIHHL